MRINIIKPWFHISHIYYRKHYKLNYNGMVMKFEFFFMSMQMFQIK